MSEMDADKNLEQDPLALGGINERRLVAAFLEFLKTKSEKSETTGPVRENLEGLFVLAEFYSMGDQKDFHLTLGKQPVSRGKCQIMNL